MKKIGRNDPCPCGSGKKFKKCCESTMLGGRFKATKIDAESAPQVRQSANLTNLFKSHLPQNPSTSPAISPDKTLEKKKED
jgi:hypothetical protein